MKKGEHGKNMDPGLGDFEHVPIVALSRAFQLIPGSRQPVFRGHGERPTKKKEPGPGSTAPLTEIMGHDSEDPPAFAQSQPPYSVHIVGKLVALCVHGDHKVSLQFQQFITKANEKTDK